MPSPAGCDLYYAEQCQVRDKAAAHNLTLMRELSTKVLKSSPVKDSIRGERAVFMGYLGVKSPTVSFLLRFCGLALFYWRSQFSAVCPHISPPIIACGIRVSSKEAQSVAFIRASIHH